MLSCNTLGSFQKINTFLKQLQFAPNPVIDFIIIKDVVKGNYLVTINDMKGNSFIAKQADIDKFYKFDVSVLPKGFYVIKVVNDKAVLSAKFYKQ